MRIELKTREGWPRDGGEKALSRDRVETTQVTEQIQKEHPEEPQESTRPQGRARPVLRGNHLVPIHGSKRTLLALARCCFKVHWCKFIDPSSPHQISAVDR